MYLNKIKQSIWVKICLLLLPRTHRIHVRDAVGLREGRRKPWKLTRCWFLIEGWGRSDVESPSLFTSDEEVHPGPCLYRDGAGERWSTEKQGERWWKLHKFALCMPFCQKLCFFFTFPLPFSLSFAKSGFNPCFSQKWLHIFPKFTPCFYFPSFNLSVINLLNLSLPVMEKY